jgi:hypothetical protein
MYDYSWRKSPSRTIDCVRKHAILSATQPKKKAARYEGGVQMDPVTLAVATSAITVLAHKVTESAASSAGKDLWEKIKKLLVLPNEPDKPKLPKLLAEKLLKDERTLNAALELLANSGEADEVSKTARTVYAKQYIEHIDAREGGVTFK